MTHLGRTYIHIGYHKSASTFLQKAVFPHLPVNYVYLSGHRRKILNMVESSTEFDATKLREWVRDKVLKDRNGCVKDTTVLSQEELSGHPHGYSIVDRYVTARNLKATFPEGRILIVLRNQLDYLTSIYTYRVTIKGQEFRSFRRFLDEEAIKGLYEHLMYHRLVSYYMDLFGSNCVKIVFVEQLKRSQREFLDEINSFFEIATHNLEIKRVENESTKLVYVLAFMRLLNSIFCLALTTLLFVSGKDKREYEPEVFKDYYPFIALRYGYYDFKKWATRILNKLFAGSRKICIRNYPNYYELVERFGESNAALERLLKREIGNYGYPVKKAGTQSG